MLYKQGNVFVNQQPLVILIGRLVLKINSRANLRAVRAIDWTTCSENQFALQRVLLEFSAMPYSQKN